MLREKSLQRFFGLRIYLGMLLNVCDITNEIQTNPSLSSEVMKGYSAED